MLTKKQLKDAARCCGGLCELCSCNKTRMAYQDCIREAAKTALAYREMLEEVIKHLSHCPFFAKSIDLGCINTKKVASLRHC